MKNYICQSTVVYSKEGTHTMTYRVCLHVVILDFIKVVASDAVVCIRGKHSLAITLYSQTLNSHSFPRVQDVAFQVTLIELSTHATTHKLSGVLKGKSEKFSCHELNPLR